MPLKKIAPWAHQAADLAATRDLPAAAIPWEPRCGKSKLAIDTAAHLYGMRKIDAAVVNAPNGVHLNWSREELSLHWPYPDTLVVEWDSGRAGTKRYQARLEAALAHVGFVWLAVNVEALATPRLSGYLKRFLARRRCLLVTDESHSIKNPRSQRAKALLRLVWPGLYQRRRSYGTLVGPAPALRPTAPYRRNLSATPAPQGPFDLFSQYLLLDPGLLGTTFSTFRARYGQFKKNRVITCPSCGTVDNYERLWGKQSLLRCLTCRKTFPVFGPLFDELVQYRHLDELNARIAPITFPRKKRDCLDLPPRRMKTLPDGTASEVLGIPQYFVLSPEQRRVYDELRDEMVARLDEGTTVSTTMALTQLLRLQQVSRGHVTLDDGTARDLGEPHPAAEATVELVREHLGKSIVWCRHVPDVELLKKVFTEAGIGVIRCDGSVPQADRPGLRARFRDEPRETSAVWLGTIGTGGVGVDLPSASLMVFYSHGFDYAQRAQALERNYGSNQRADHLEVVDLVAADTADEKALASYERKENLAAQLTGRQLRELLT